MGFFDQMGYNLAPLLGPIGKGIADAQQDTRVANYYNTLNAAPSSATVMQTPIPDNVYDPAHIKELENLRLARLGTLQQTEAAPLAKALAQMKAEGNDADPNFSGAEWVRGMLTTPALGGTMTEDQYDGLKTGAVPAARKGALPITDFAANPVVADMLQKAELAAQNKGTMARVFAGGYQARPLDLANVAMDKDQAIGFKDTNQGINDLGKEKVRGQEAAAANTMNQTIASYPLTRDTTSWNGLADKLYSIPNIKPEVVNATLRDIAGRNKAPAGSPLSLYAQSGDATTSGSVQTDMFGEPIDGTKVTATNHPRPSTVNITDRDAARQHAREFQNDLTYKRSLERAVATGGKGMIMIDGVPTSFDGSAEAIAALTRMRDDQIETMNQLYPDEMKARSPKAPPAAKPAAAAAPPAAKTFWKSPPK